MLKNKTTHRGRPAKLDISKVMSVALQIADEEGLQALSLRGVARGCGVTPMALYRHVETVHDLEELAFRLATQDIASPTLKGNWREQVKSIWSGFRSTLLVHPGAAAIFAKRAMPTPEIIEATSLLFVVLEKYGFSRDAAFLAYDATFIFTLGSIRFELSRTEDARRPLIEKSIHDELETVLSHYSKLISQRNADKMFEKGLDVLLEGLECLRSGRKV